MIHKNNLFLRVEVTFNRYRSRSFGDISAGKCNYRVTYHTLACHVVLLALASVTFGVVISRHVPWVKLLCLTTAIYHVVKKYETNEPQLIIAIG